MVLRHHEDEEEAKLDTYEEDSYVVAKHSINVHYLHLVLLRFRRRKQLKV